MKTKALLTGFLSACLVLGVILFFYLGDFNRKPAAPAPAPPPINPPSQGNNDKAPSPPTQPAVQDGQTPFIAGKVLLETGKPAWRAKVQCKLGPMVVLKETRTNRLGEFVFRDLDRDTSYAIEASTDTHAPLRLDSVDVNTKDVLITLSFGARLVVEVLTGDVGMPLDNFEVSLMGREAKKIPLTNAGGRAKIENLKSGHYQVQVLADGYEASENKGVTLKAGQETRASFLVYPDQ